MGFTHLHVHTEFSLLDGMGRVEDIVQAAVNDRQKAIAITDHGNGSGWLKMRNACLAAGIKPILGIELYLAANDDRHNPEHITVVDDGQEADSGADTQGRLKRKYHQHLTVLATSHIGYRNLVSVHNEAGRTPFGPGILKRPVADTALLAEHSEDLVCLTGCLGGPIAGPVSRGDIDEARTNLERLIEVFGHSNVYVEIMDHGVDAETNNLRTLAALADEYGVPLVVTNDCHIAHEDDAHAHKAWLAHQSKRTVDDPKAFSFHGSGFHVRTEEEMRTIHAGKRWQQACDVTNQIADRCVEDPLDGLLGRKLPHFPKLPAGETEQSYLHTLMGAGAKARYGLLTPEIKERLRLEEDTFVSADVCGYMLIGWDMMKFARSQGIAVGAGRGSAAGSAAAYALRITDVDPLRHHLLFERFYEPGRLDLPDIDFDFEARRRDEIMAYLVDTYGASKVARIGTFGVARSRKALKDAARVLGLPMVGSRLSNAVPVEAGKPLTFCELDDVDNRGGLTFRELVAKGDRYHTAHDMQSVVDLARTFEGLVSNQGIHACGTIISDESLLDLIPLRYEFQNGDIVGTPIALWEASDIEEFGLVKLDVLGLNNLDRVAEAMTMIGQTTGESLSLDTLPNPDLVSDKRTHKAWKLLGEARVEGVFQVEGQGMKKLLSEARPTGLPDLSAILALYRPGPMSAGSHDHFAARNSGTETVSYSKYSRDPEEVSDIASVLDETKGLIVFQEQIMRLGSVVAGFDAGDRSKLRKAIGKKNEELMALMGELFVSNATEEFRDAHGVLLSRSFSESTAQRLWADIVGAGEYAFNQSHSVAYGALTFINAYLKANWPVEFGAAVLAMTSDATKRRSTLRGLLSEDIEVAAPSLNHGSVTTQPVDGCVVIGLSEIKDVGKDAIHIVRERDENGAFKDIFDLVERVRVPSGEGSFRVLSTKTVEALIESGAMDDFGPRMGQLQVVFTAKSARVSIPQVEFGEIERQARQRVRLGLAMGKNPLVAHKKFLSGWRSRDTSSDRFGVAPVSLRKAVASTGRVLTIGVIAAWSATGGKRAEFTIEGSGIELDGVMWRDSLVLLDATGRVPSVGDVVGVFGRNTSREVSRYEIDAETGEETETVELISQFTADNLWPIKLDDEPVKSEEAMTSVRLVFSDNGCIVESEGRDDMSGRRELRVVEDIHDSAGLPQAEKLDRPQREAWVAQVETSTAVHGDDIYLCSDPNSRLDSSQLFRSEPELDPVELERLLNLVSLEAMPAVRGVYRQLVEIDGVDTWVHLLSGVDMSVRDTLIDVVWKRPRSLGGHIDVAEIDTLAHRSA